MTTITEGNLTFRFPAGCQASKYDDWSFYRNQFQSVAGGSKAIDILCVEGDDSWLIEVKDYRASSRTKATDMADELAMKVRDTLAGLAVAAKKASKTHERQHARQSLKNRRWRIVLHLEQSTSPRRLWRVPIDIGTLLLKLKSRKLKVVDAHPIICDRNSLPNRIPWTVQ